MLLNPRKGQRVQVWYAVRYRCMPLHGKLGVVEIVSRGKPRNHGVRIIEDGVLYVVPCGNLRKPVKGNDDAKA